MVGHRLRIIGSIEDLVSLKIEVPRRLGVHQALESLVEFEPSWTHPQAVFDEVRASTSRMTSVKLARALGVSRRRLQRLRHQEIEPSLGLMLRWATVAHKEGGPDRRLRIRAPGRLKVDPVRARGRLKVDPVLDFERRFREAVLADIIERAGPARDPDTDVARSDYDALREITRSGVTWADAMALFGRFLLERALAEEGGSPARAARRLGLSRSRVYKLIADHWGPLEAAPRLRPSRARRGARARRD